jgi:ribonuclease HI
MELSGVILGLTATPPHVEIEVKTDSQYVVQGIAGNWKLKLNLDLWEILRVLVADRKVTFTWIPRNSEAGHASVDGAANRISKECPKKA